MKNLYFILFVISMFVIGYLVSSKEKIIENHTFQTEYENLKYVCLQEQKNKNIFLENIPMVDYKDSIVWLHDVEGLIFRYSELNCKVCIDSTLNMLKNTKVIILASYKDKRHLDIFARTNKIANSIYKIDSLNLPIDKANLPYFIKDQEIFIPLKEFPERTIEFLKFIR